MRSVTIIVLGITIMIVSATDGTHTMNVINITIVIVVDAITWHLCCIDPHVAR